MLGCPFDVGKCAVFSWLGGVVKRGVTETLDVQIEVGNGFRGLVGEGLGILLFQGEKLKMFCIFCLGRDQCVEAARRMVFSVETPNVDATQFVLRNALSKPSAYFKYLRSDFDHLLCDVELISLAPKGHSTFRLVGNDR